MKRLIWTCLAVSAIPAAGWTQPGSVLTQPRADRTPTQPSTTERPAKPTSLAGAIVTEAPSVRLSVVTVEGSSLPKAAFDLAFAPFIGRPLSRAAIQEIAEAAGAVYRRSGMALYTVNAFDQDLSKGELRLTALEGHVAQVALQGDVRDRDLKLVTAYADALASERPLRRETLERHLSLIRDIPGLSAEAELRPSATPDALILVLTLKQRRSDLALSIDNRGSDILGRTQLQADLSLYGLTRQGDETRLTLAAPTDVRRFQYLALTHSQPIGFDGLRAQVSVGALRTRPKGFPIKGRATTAGAQLSYPLIRSYEQNLILTGAIDALNSTNAVFGQGVSSERTRVVRAAAAWSRTAPRSALSAGATLSAGLDGLGARVSPGLADTSFRKLNLRVSADRALARQAVARLRLGAQLTGDALPDSEKFALGGAAFGRAFEQAAYLGDRAAAAAVEVAWRPVLPGRLNGSEAYGFVDRAQAVIKRRPGLFDGVTYDTGSAGLGVRVAMNADTAVGVEGAYAYRAPTRAEEKAWRLGFTLRTIR